MNKEIKEDFDEKTRKQKGPYVELVEVPKNNENITTEDSITVKSKEEEPDLSNRWKRFVEFFRKRKNILLRCRKIFINLLGLALFFLSVYSYKRGLQGCEGTQAHCVSQYTMAFIYKLAFFVILSAFILVSLFALMIKRVISWLHSIYIIPSYIYILFYYDTGSDLFHHGSYNKWGYLLVVFVLVLLYSIVFLFDFLRKKKRYKTMIALIIGMILIYFYNVYSMKHSCKNWIYGIGGIKIENDPSRDKCHFIKPERCMIDYLNGWQDISWYLGEKCTNRRGNEKKALIQRLPKESSGSLHFAFPITTNWSWVTGEKESRFGRFVDFVYQRIIDLDKTNIKTLKEQPEVFVTFNKKKKGTVDIKIQRNEELVKERQEAFNKLSENEKPRYKNILFIYIDALSRAHFMRKMKNLISFLNKYVSGKDKTRTVYQMMKVQGFAAHTDPNVDPMFFGESYFSHNGTYFTKALKKKGFITAQSIDFCSRMLYDVEIGEDTKLVFDNYDHENIAFFCDPNYYDWPSPYSVGLGPYSMKRRCLYGKDAYQYVLDYGEKFWEAYINERKFLRIAFQDSHEGTGEVVRYLDIGLGKFLNSFLSKGYLDDTGIFIVSDHGTNMFGIYGAFRTEDYVIEYALPTWIMVLQNKETEEEKINLTENQQKLVTAYDIHNTILDMAGFNETYYSRNGNSIFNYINSKERSCESYDFDHIVNRWCRCENYKN